MNITPGQEMIEITIGGDYDHEGFLNCAHCGEELLYSGWGQDTATTLGELVNTVLLHAAGCANMSKPPLDL